MTGLCVAHGAPRQCKRNWDHRGRTGEQMGRGGGMETRDGRERENEEYGSGWEWCKGGACAMQGRRTGDARRTCLTVAATQIQS